MDMSDDLQTDCAEVGPASNMRQNLADPSRLKLATTKHLESQQQDSGIYSFESQGFRSVDNVADDEFIGNNQRIAEEVDDGLHQQMSRMQITEEPEISHCAYQKTPGVPTEEDEGYTSKSLPSLGCQPVSAIQEGQLIYSLTPTEEAIEAYSQDDDGDTQLHMAIIQLAEEIALQLVNIAPKFDWLNTINFLLQTPLHLAVITQQPRIVRRLMVAGASVDCRDLHGNTPLHIAAREGYTDCINHLLTPVTYPETLENKYEIPYQRIPQDLEVKNYEGHTPLHLAAQGSHVRTMDLLVKKRVNINAQDGKSGRTVLHYAAETGNRILLEFLLNCADIDLNCCTYGGLTPVVLAAGRSFGDVVRILHSRGADCSGLLEDGDEEEMIDDFCLDGSPLQVT